jgi:hypothetical protein
MRREPDAEQVRAPENRAENHEPSCMAQEESAVRERFVGGCDDVSEPGSVHLEAPPRPVKIGVSGVNGYPTPRPGDKLIQSLDLCFRFRCPAKF